MAPMMMMMMKLKLVAIAFGVAQAATKICADDGAFDGTLTTAMGPCSVIQLLVPAFTADKTSCAKTMTLPGGGSDSTPMKTSMFTSMLSACCKTGSDVCAAFALNPCATASDYKPTLVFKQDGSDMTCAAWSAMATMDGAASEATCAAKVTIGENSMANAVITGMAASKGCCGSGKSNCEEFTMTPCADKAKLLPGKNVEGTADGMACETAMASLGEFVPSKETCAAKITLGSDTTPRTRTAITADAAKHCCSDKVSICAAYGAATNAGTEVTSGSAGASVAKIFFAIVALAPQMLA